MQTVAGQQTSLFNRHEQERLFNMDRGGKPQSTTNDPLAELPKAVRDKLKDRDTITQADIDEAMRETHKPLENQRGLF